MKQQLQRIGLAVMVAFVLPLCSFAQTDTLRKYTEDHPLVYEDSWDLWPYAFLDELGHPRGFNVELIELMMKEENIPCIIKLKPRSEVLTDLRDGRADLTLGMDAHFHSPYGSFGQSVVQLFTHSLLSPKGRPAAVKSLQDLGRQEVIVHGNSFSHNLMKQRGWEDNAVIYDDMKEAVQQLSTHEQGQILWNTASLKWLLHMFQIENLQLTPVDMPHGEYKFMANDSTLLAQMDKTFSAVRASGRVEPLQIKWFYPEREDTGIPSWIWYLAGGIALVVLVLIYYNVSYRTRERRMLELGRQRNSRLALILQTSHVRMWTYDVARQTFTWFDQNGQPQREYTSIEFARRYHAEDFERLCDGLHQLATMQEKKIVMELNARDEDSTNGDERVFTIALSVLRYEDGKPTVILGTKSDVTEERLKQQQTKERLIRYKSVFNTAMVDMVYYDEKGDITNMNERAQRTFHMSLTDTVKEHVNVRTAIEDPNLNLDEFETYHATQFLNTAGENRNIKSRKLKSVMFYELQLVPVFDSLHRLLCIYGTGRDVTEVADAYHQVQRGIKEIQKATEEVTDYVKNINYVLGVGGVRMANYSPETHTLTIYKGLNQIQHALTQSRCMTLIDEKSEKVAMRTLNSMDNRSTNTIDAEVKTTIRLKGMPLYLHFRFIPTFDEQGRVVSYFGLCRDVSLMKATEVLLEKETARAQEEEDLKNSFLRNMNYEIRTPLNTVVGFAELFEQDHSPEDEEIFIKEIKENSAHLLDLINDILFLSRLDAHMIELNKQPTDFAKTFEGYCQMGWANDQHEGVRYVVENHYEQLVVDIDDANMGRIIEQITANAAQHTTTGTVRARYDYIGDKLMIAIEDTGSGMTPEALSHIYERFASGAHQGTGLGLPICKELVEQLGGSINISSEPGKGTTVWITMPCTATSIDRKKEL